MQTNLLKECWIPLIDRSILDGLEEPFYPRRDLVYRVFNMDIRDIKVILLEQDPYYTPEGMATGLSFINGIEKIIPVSLRNMYKKLSMEGFEDPNINNWEQQGIFLLNTALTVYPGEPNSHKLIWRNFIISIIRYISNYNPSIFILLGSNAKSFKPFISNQILVDNYENLDIMPYAPQYNYIIESTHPASEVYNKGSFLNSKDIFLTCNTILKNKKEKEISW